MIEKEVKVQNEDEAQNEAKVQADQTPLETPEEVEMRKDLDRILSLAKVVRVKFDKDEDKRIKGPLLSSPLLSSYMKWRF